MREIKFRAWDKVAKRMIYTCLPLQQVISLNGKVLEPELNYGDGRYVYDENSPEICYKTVDRYILQQFTGLKDRKNKEIYEGDVLENIESKRQFVVFFEEFSASFKCKEIPFANKYDGGNEVHTLDEGMESNHSEVIGNIYENPELVEEG